MQSLPPLIGVMTYCCIFRDESAVEFMKEGKKSCGDPARNHMLFFAAKLHHTFQAVLLFN